MNETELRDLVEHDRTGHGVAPAPTAAILERARASRTRRRGAWAAGVAALVVAASLAVVAALPDTRPTTHPSGPVDPTPGNAFAPPPGTRWTGQGRVVVAVPSSWQTIETPFCQDPPTHSIVYFNVDNASAGCPYNGFVGHDRESYLSIEPSEGPPAHRADPIQIGQLHGYAWSRPGQGYAALLVPREKVVLYVVTPKPRLADRIISSVREVPAGYEVVPPVLFTADDPSETLRGLGLHPRTVEQPPAPDSPYGFPGRFMATDPPVGSPVARGSSVTAYLSAGRLDTWVKDASFQAHGWMLSPPSSFDPPITRDRAWHLADPDRTERATFLRTLRIGHRSRLAWIVIDHPKYWTPGRYASVTAVDARTGRTIASDTDFTSG